MQRVCVLAILVSAAFAACPTAGQADQDTASPKAQVYQLQNALESSRSRADTLARKNERLRQRVKTLEQNIHAREGRIAMLEQRLSATADIRKAIRQWKWRARLSDIRATRAAQRAEVESRRVDRLNRQLAKVRGKVSREIADLRGQVETFFGRVAKVLPGSGDLESARKQVDQEAAGGPMGVDGVAEEVSVLSERVRRARAALQSVPIGEPIQKGKTSSRYGPRRHPVTGERDYHQGVDFAADIGTPIRSTGAGHVTQRTRDNGYGKFVKIKHGDRRITLYAHMSRFAVEEGDQVERGEVIGYVGNSGISTGPHVHYEIRSAGDHLDPEHYTENLDGVRKVVGRVLADRDTSGDRR